MSNYRDNYYGSILDPLHGDIKLSEIEKWCLSQPIFARLRYVKQNTFLYYVFPSANHTRFEHSIGVMHVAGKIFDACKENYATGVKKREKYDIEDNSFFDLNNLGLNEEIFYQELRLAALLHDIGHGPMSHLFDEFAISKDKFLALVKDSNILSPYEDGFKVALNKKEKVEHEIISCAFIFYLINQLKNATNRSTTKFSKSASKVIQDLSGERIVKMIMPTFTGLNDTLKDSKGHDYTSFFSKIVTAFPIDADRMDYLLRDSYFAGVTYGVYDLHRIYSSFQAKCSKNFEVDIIFKSSGVESMLRFIQSRSHLYNQVYFHKTNRAVNSMLMEGTLSIRESSSKLLDDRSSFNQLVDFYIENSDEHFVRQTITDKVEGVQKVILNELRDRKLFKRIYEKKIVLRGTKEIVEKKKTDIKSIRDQIRARLNQLNDSNIYAVVDFYENKTFKDSDDKTVALGKKDLEKKEYVFIYDWRKAGNEFELADMLVCMLRIYLRRQFDSPAMFKEMSDQIIKNVKDQIKNLEEL